MSLMFLCIKIFLARILDVSLDIIRTLEVVKGRSKTSAFISFFEVFIWFLVVREAITTNEFNLIIAICYALGYACGTLFGSYVSKYLIKGSSSVIVISSKINNKNISLIKNNNYGVSSLTLDNKSKMLLIVVDNRNIKELLRIIRGIDSKSFINILDAKTIYNGHVK